MKTGSVVWVVRGSDDGNIGVYKYRKDAEARAKGYCENAYITYEAKVKCDVKDEYRTSYSKGYDSTCEAVKWYVE